MTRTGSPFGQACVDLRTRSVEDTWWPQATREQSPRFLIDDYAALYCDPRSKKKKKKEKRKRKRESYIYIYIYMTKERIIRRSNISSINLRFPSLTRPWDQQIQLTTLQKRNMRTLLHMIILSILRHDNCKPFTVSRSSNKTSADATESASHK